jgi:carbonic anhydrase/acetyltransferase-like protein (isoleucine patch superfamily)
MVRIGYRTNIQDGTVIEEAPDALGPDHDGSVMVGNYVTVGTSQRLSGSKGCS